jgi:hypothetical protein
MPFIFLIVGVVFVTVGLKRNSQCLMTLLTNDIKGSNNFIYWIISIGIIGSLGYVQELRGFSRALLALVIIVLVLAEDKQGSGGFFTEFQSAIKTITGG